MNIIKSAKLLEECDRGAVTVDHDGRGDYHHWHAGEEQTLALSCLIILLWIIINQEMLSSLKNAGVSVKIFTSHQSLGPEFTQQIVNMIEVFKRNIQT